MFCYNITWSARYRVPSTSIVSTRDLCLYTVWHCLEFEIRLDCSRKSYIFLSMLDVLFLWQTCGSSKVGVTKTNSHVNVGINIWHVRELFSLQMNIAIHSWYRIIFFNGVFSVWIVKSPAFSKNPMQFWEWVMWANG